MRGYVRGAAALAAALVSCASFAQSSAQPTSAAAVDEGAAASAEAPAGAARPRAVVLYYLSGGRRSAANAIAQATRELAPHYDVVVKDVADFQAPEDAERALRLYNLATQRFPAAFDLWYRAHVHVGGGRGALGRWYRGLGIERSNPDLNAYLRSLGPIDAIFSTFEDATGALLAARRNGEIDPSTRIAHVMTDYVARPLFQYLAEESDVTFAPNRRIRDALVAGGARRDQAIASGIPIGSRDARRFTADERRAALEEIGFSADRPSALLVSGSRGVGDFAEMVRSLSAAAVRARGPRAIPLQVAVVAGSNEAQKAAVEDLVRSGAAPGLEIRAFGRVPERQMHALMRAVDAIATKAGGLSSTEIATFGAPVVFLDINGGHESDNVREFVQAGAALSARSEREVGEPLVRLVTSPELRARVSAAQAAVVESEGIGSIVNWLVGRRAGQAEEPRANGLGPSVGETPGAESGGARASRAACGNFFANAGEERR